MKITILGSGTSQGVPVIGCRCPVCTSDDPRDQRLRSSILIEQGTTAIVVDAGPDFRQQMLRTGLRKLDAILISHTHKDHIAGLDDVRSFNYLMKRPMRIYSTLSDQEAIRQEFAYAFSDNPYPGVPQFEMLLLGDKPFQIGEIPVQSFKVMHHRLPVNAFRFGDAAYITDVSHIPASALHHLRNLKVLIIDALRMEKHVSHFSLPEAIEVAKKIGAEQTWFTHISHLMGKYAEVQLLLPPGMQLACDGLIIDL
ncbi:MAG TPA: MBL fold metallo-hydrolase [Bacteroidales bacterium]|nr:MBL fold metallo-hydrolase [Bacteroidales bacterium]